MRISDWSSDVCSSDLGVLESGVLAGPPSGVPAQRTAARRVPPAAVRTRLDMTTGRSPGYRHPTLSTEEDRMSAERSEEHTSELQSLMRISYAVFCLKKKNH